MEDNKGSAEVVDRKEGFYWCKYQDGPFVVCEWWQGAWLIPGSDENYDDIWFQEIDERQVCRS